MCFVWDAKPDFLTFTATINSAEGIVEDVNEEEELVESKFSNDYQMNNKSHDYQMNNKSHDSYLHKLLILRE